MPSEKNRKQQWQTILQLTQQLKQLLADEEWESMAALESRRQELLTAYFASPVSPAEAEQIAIGIKHMLHINTATIEAGKAKQSELSGSVRQLSTNRQAIHAYHDVQK